MIAIKNNLYVTSKAYFIEKFRGRLSLIDWNKQTITSSYCNVSRGHSKNWKFLLSIVHLSQELLKLSKQAICARDKWTKLKY